ncbi:MAG: hypothetical protein NC393_00250 [Clostridium sp.]|nr:hypothetical protein [Clostridium sp.]MCM1170537.1 hypothetical protein [Clostridium sp.]MCM1207926.1 hypothetical protein [Ruminococcus sp.]
MPRNQFQRMIFALITVVITVHAYVFYSLYIVNGATLMSVNNETSVIRAINSQGGVYMLGSFVPVWSVVLTEFCLAYILEVIMGSPLSFKLASRIFDPRKNHPMIFESAIICATVGLMCPAMSLIAAFLYYPYYAGFSIIGLLATWLKLVCYNFPFAFFTQLFFIQPAVRVIFKTIFAKDIKARMAKGDEERAEDEADVIADIFKRMEVIQEGLAHERRQRKLLAEEISGRN